MEKRPSDPIRYQFRLRDPNTGALVDPDAALAATVVRNGVDDPTATAAFPPVVTRQSLGQFQMSATVPANYVLTDDVQIRVDGTVAGNAFSSYSRFTVGAKLASDLPTAAAVAAAVWNEPKSAHTGAGTFGLFLDAAVSSRSIFAGGAVASVTAPVTVGTITDKAGYSLAPAGLDSVTVEAGVNFRQSQAAILAASAGALLGAGTGSIVIKGGNVATTRITASTDNAGNRTSVTLSLPA